MDKELNTRIIHKHDVAENWAKAVNFVPKQGELIVYDIDDNYTYERFKIGDGVTLVSALPFMPDPSDKMLVVTGTLNDGNILTTDYTSEQIIAHINNGGSTMLSLPGEELVLPLYMADCESTADNPSTMVAYGGVTINKSEGCVQNRIFVVSGNTVVADNTPYEPDLTGFLKIGDTYTKTEIDEKVVDLSESVEDVRDELALKADKTLVVTATMNSDGTSGTTDYTSAEIIEHINAGGETRLLLNDTFVPYMFAEDGSVFYGVTMVSVDGIEVYTTLFAVSVNDVVVINCNYDPEKAGFATTGNVYTKTEIDEKVVDLTEAVENLAVGGHVWYGTTDTAGDVVQKAVTTTTGDFVLAAGAVLFVEFANTHTANTMSLKIDNGSSGAAFSADYTALKPNIVQRGEMACFVYNGNAFIMVRSQVATTSNYGVTKLNAAINSTSQGEAATPSAVKQAYDLANTANTAVGNVYTKTEIDEKVVDINEAIDAADKVLVVTATAATSDGVEYYTTNYSSAEIISHINNGGITVLDVAGFMMLPYLQTQDNKVYYSKTIIDSPTVVGSITMIVSGNTATIMTVVYDPEIPDYSATEPLMNGTASVGAAETVSRSDHVHPTDTSRASQADFNALDTYVNEMYVKLDGIEEGAIARHVWYGVDMNPASSNGRLVETTTGDFSAEDGAIIFIKFQEGYTADMADIIVDNRAQGHVFTANHGELTANMIQAEEVVPFIYIEGEFIMARSSAATETGYGVVKLSSAINSTATDTAATSSAVNDVRNTAENAQTAADEAKTEASDARVAAEHADSTANDALNLANGLQVDVNTAMRTASDASSVANSASTTADNALSKANSASSAANSAKTTANAALPKAGGTMTGTLILAADPVNALEAATKQYVDNLIGDIETAMTEINTILGGS